MFLLLVLQFLLGMFVNLFVTIPASHPGSAGGGWPARSLASVLWGLLHGGVAVGLHVALGIVLGVWSAVLLLRLRVAGRRGAWIVLGWVGVWAAGANGASFLDFGMDLSSALMALGFAMALLSYGMLMRAD